MAGSATFDFKKSKDFAERVKNPRSCKTPGTPNFHIIWNTDPELALPKEQHKEYRSRVGMLLYLVKYSRPDIANPVRELSRVLVCATDVANRELFRVIKTDDMPNGGPRFTLGACIIL